MFHEQKKNTRILALCGMAMTSLLLWGCGGNMSPTGQVAERSDYYTRGIGQYPGSPKEDFSPSLAPNVSDSTLRSFAWASSSPMRTKTISFPTIFTSSAYATSS